MVSTKSITNDLLNRSITFLDSINAPDRMKSLLRDRLDVVIAKTSENGIISNMKELSNGAHFLIIVNLLHSGYRRVWDLNNRMALFIHFG